MHLFAEFWGGEVMRLLVVTLIVTLIICIFSVYSVTFLDQTATEMVTLLNRAEKAIFENNWEMVENNIKDFSKKWEKQHAIWAILIEHSEIDNIDIRLAYLESYIKTKSIPETLGEINALLKYLEHIPGIEKLTIQNLL